MSQRAAFPPPHLPYHFLYSLLSTSKLQLGNIDEKISTDSVVLNSDLNGSSNEFTTKFSKIVAFSLLHS